MDEANDMLAITTQLAADVQLCHLTVNQYLASAHRDPLDLPEHKRAMYLLEAQQYVWGRVPLHVYQLHARSTAELLQNLRQIEDGLAMGYVHGQSLIRSRFDISREMLEQCVVQLKWKDLQIADNIGTSVSSIRRRRADFGLMTNALKNSTPDEVVAEVSSLTPR
jgi:hypothetical protein